MQPEVKPVKKVSNIGYKYSLIQGILVLVTLFMMAGAGPESTASGAFFGFGGMLLGLITFAVAPVSLVVFLIYTIKSQSYKKPDGYFIVSVICQILNVIYLILASKLVGMLFSWNS